MPKRKAAEPAEPNLIHSLVGPRPQPKDPAAAAIRNILNDHLDEMLGAVYTLGFQAGFERATTALRSELIEISGEVGDRISERREQRPLALPPEPAAEPPLPHFTPTPKQRALLTALKQFPDGITEVEFRKQTGRAGVGLWKLHQKGVLEKRGSRYYLPKECRE